MTGQRNSLFDKPIASDSYLEWDGEYFAVPSWVISGTVAQNALFLQNRVKEIGLCLFEWKSCLDYGANDLPQWLADMPFNWHAHMPQDLPWKQGAEKTAEICRQLLAKIAFLKPRFLVLHPPPQNGKTLLSRFATHFNNALQLEILLENTCSAESIMTDASFLAKNGFGCCLDLAHAMQYGQLEFLHMANQARLVHWSAPGKKDEHRPLTQLDENQRKLLKKTSALFSGDVTHMLEIFTWQGICESLPLFRSMTTDVKGH